MNLSAETLVILLYLTPGLLASLVFDTIVVRPKKDKDVLTRIVEGLVFSLLIYGSVAVFSGKFPAQVVINQGVETKAQFYYIAFEGKLLIPVIIASVFLPLLLGALWTHDLHMKLLRLLKITNKTARETVWFDVFTDQKRYVVVNLTHGKRVFGWPMYYSTDPTEGLLYLYDAAWIDSNGEPIEIDVHGLLLVKKDNIDSIEFTNIDKTNAKAKTSGGKSEQTGSAQTP